jgi:hypothetical protein
LLTWSAACGPVQLGVQVADEFVDGDGQQIDPAR